MTRPPRPQLTRETRAVLRTALLSGDKPLKVCVDHGASWASVLRIQREMRLELMGVGEER